jgi:hypothetical protein
MTAHNYTQTIQDIVTVALHAGADRDCRSFYSKHAQEALDSKPIVESDIKHLNVRSVFLYKPASLIHSNNNLIVV